VSVRSETGVTPQGIPTEPEPKVFAMSAAELQSDKEEVEATTNLRDVTPVTAALSVRARDSRSLYSKKG
jgi:hypothetical protein